MRASHLLLAVVVLLAGCATTQEARQQNDPLEPFNRAMFATNLKLNDYVMHPVIVGYDTAVPHFMRIGVHNFFNNLGYPNVFLNDFLQGRAVQGLHDVGRFVVNSVLGIGGLFDPAGPMGLGAEEQNFGVTMGVWGVPPGPYVVLPFLGPYNARGLPDLPISIFDDPAYYWNSGLAQNVLFGVGTVDKADAAQPAIRQVEQSISPYDFARNGFRQHEAQLVREAKGEHGPPPLSPIEEEELGILPTQPQKGPSPPKGPLPPKGSSPTPPAQKPAPPGPGQ